MGWLNHQVVACLDGKMLPAAMITRLIQQVENEMKTIEWKIHV